MQCMTITVDALLLYRFSNRTRQQKINIVLQGKPRPALENLVSVKNVPSSSDSTGNNSSKYVIIFDRASYDHVEWLTGCDKRQALFCWPCLLFRSPASVSCWTHIGLNDLSNLGEKIRQHEHDVLHIQSFLDLQIFSSTILQAERPPLPPLENKDFERNREIAKRIIDVICYLVTQQKPPQKGSRDKNVLEVEDCLENLHFLRDYDILQASLIDDAVEKIQKAPKIISDMIEAITKTVLKAIQKELLHSNYASVILSEHLTEHAKSQISMVLRYLRNGEVCERFIGFTHTPRMKTPKLIFQRIEQVINDYQIYQRAIACSFDGAILATNPALSEIRQYYLALVHFVPCHFHELDDVLLRSLAFSSDCDLFFKNVMVIKSYFQEETNVCLKYKKNEDSNPDDIQLDDFQAAIAECCTNYSGCLNTIKTHRLSIIDSFDKALAENRELTDSDVVKLKALRTFLTDFKNTFLLEMLLKLLDVVAPLVEAFKSPFPGLAFDTNLVQCILKSFDDELQNGAFECFWLKTVQDFIDSNTKEQLLSSSFGKHRNHCSRLYTEVTQCFKNQIQFRFEDASEFSFCQILDLESSAKSLNFKHVQTLVEKYGSVFDYASLDREIKSVIGNKSAGNSVHELYKFFVTSGLGSSYTNLNKLCELVLTLPSTNPDVMYSAGTKLDEIKEWSHGELKQHSRDIVFLCVEQDYLMELKSKGSFFDDVITVFQESSKTLELA